MTGHYANIITTRYKSAKDLELAMERLQGMKEGVSQTDGLCAVIFVRTDKTATQHVALYTSQEAAEAGAAALLPRFKEAVAPHADGAPEQAGGTVPLTVINH